MDLDDEERPQRVPESGREPVPDEVDDLLQLDRALLLKLGQRSLLDGLSYFGGPVG